MWCEEENVVLNQSNERDGKKPVKIPKRYRCPKCKKRFETFTRTADGGYNITYMPKHKVPVKKPRLPAKSTKGIAARGK